jgi:hypothetical protein
MKIARHHWKLIGLVTEQAFAYYATQESGEKGLTEVLDNYRRNLAEARVDKSRTDAYKGKTWLGAKMRATMRVRKYERLVSVCEERLADLKTLGKDGFKLRYRGY